MRKKYHNILVYYIYSLFRTHAILLCHVGEDPSQRRLFLLLFGSYNDTIATEYNNCMVVFLYCKMQHYFVISYNEEVITTCTNLR